MRKGLTLVAKLLIVSVMTHDKDTHLTVMTLNLRFGLADDGANSWKYRKEAYPDLLRRFRPDFIAVQEANTFQTDYLTDFLDRYDFIGKYDPSPDFWQDNIIFFKTPWYCVREKVYFLSDTPEVNSKLPGSKWPRLCTIGVFQKGAHALIHVNTHFDFNASVQEKSARLILDFLKDFPDHIPAIVTGDFNTSPDSTTYGVFVDHGFNDPFQGAHSSTFHGFTGEDLGGHIDWILYRGNVSNVSHRIIRDRFSGIYPSDHYPVMCAFEFAPTGD